MSRFKYFFKRLASNKKMLILSILLLFGIVFSVVHLSYALFTINEEKKGAFTIVAGDLRYEYQATGLDQNNRITVPAGSAYTIPFTVSNNSSIPMDYKILYQLVGQASIPSGFEIGTIGTTQQGDVSSYPANTSKKVSVLIKNYSSVSLTIQFDFKAGLVGVPLNTNGMMAVNTALRGGEARNVTATGYDAYAYGVDETHTNVQFPTWTTYGGQDDITWTSGTNLGHGTWKRHIDIANHHNECGYYNTHMYAFNSAGTRVGLGNIYNIGPKIDTEGCIGYLYLNSSEQNFTGTQQYTLNSNKYLTNFTVEFDAKPTQTITLTNAGSSTANNASYNKILLYEQHGGNTGNAGLGLSLGTNGAMAIIHKTGVYVSVLKYEGDLSASHRYRLSVSNNVPKLYVDGKLVATGIKTSHATNVYLMPIIGKGSYGAYQGTANNFVFYSVAR